MNVMSIKTNGMFLKSFVWRNGLTYGELIYVTTRVRLRFIDLCYHINYDTSCYITRVFCGNY